MRLTQRQIEIFNAVMVHKSVTAAAAMLRTSQPTVSRELRALEKRIGFDLFHRFGRRLTPTGRALSLHEVVQRSFVGLDEIGRVAAEIGGRNAAFFRIASIPAYAEAVLPTVTRRVLDAHPHVHLVVHALEEALLHHDLTTQMFDIGLTETAHAYAGVATDQVPVGDLVCILPAGHPLCAKPLLEPADFADVPFVYFTLDDPYRRKLDEIFDAASVRRNYRVESTTATGVGSMVAAGVGVSIVNPLTAAHYARRGVEVRRFGVRLPYRIHLWHPRRGPQSSFVDRFVETLRAVLAEMTAELPARAARS